MNRDLITSIGISVVLFCLLTIFAPPAQAGPPLLCWPFDIGDAKSLPWGGSAWGAAKADYDVRKLPEDTLALLTPTTPVIVRMETLRRATVYAMKDRRIARELLERLQARARDTEAKGKPDALTLFDVGYLAEAYKQARWAPEADWALMVWNPATGLDGYALIQKAIGLRGQDAEMEFAAALVSADHAQKRRGEAHLQKAVSGAPDGSLLAENLVTHCHLLRKRASTMAELRSQLGHTSN